MSLKGDRNPQTNYFVDIENLCFYPVNSYQEYISLKILFMS